MPPGSEGASYFNFRMQLYCFFKIQQARRAKCFTWYLTLSILTLLSEIILICNLNILTLRNVYRSLRDHILAVTDILSLSILRRIRLWQEKNHEQSGIWLMGKNSMDYLFILLSMVIFFKAVGDTFFL